MRDARYEHQIEAEESVTDLLSSPLPGRHLVQVPGPTNVPERVLRAIGLPTIDHRGPAFAELTMSLLADLRPVFGTESPIVMYPGSGTGAWEAALENTLSPGDGVLVTETGQFAVLWAIMARQLGLEVTTLPTDWRRGADPQQIEEQLRADAAHHIKAVLLTQNETSTGVLSSVPDVRAAIDRAGHPALLFVDAVSSLASVDYRHDEWGVDVTIAASQKGLMLPPGLCFNAVSDKALAASKESTLPCSFWRWEPILEQNARGYFPYTPPTNLLFGLRAALDMLREEGLPQVVARHARFGAATRRAVQTWGLEVQCLDENAYSPTVTAVVMPDQMREEELRAVILARYGMSLGAGLGQLAGRVFRIGHLGDLDDLTLVAVIAGVELGLDLAHVPHQPGGVSAALEVLREGVSAPQ
jgi:alanine-glyoxylate transaminase/serine-glyoxylate transaminase/serine-pyruvate transaminase